MAEFQRYKGCFVCIVMFSEIHPSESTTVISTTSVYTTAFSSTSKKITISPAYFVCVANDLTIVPLWKMVSED